MMFAIQLRVARRFAFLIIPLAVWGLGGEASRAQIQALRQGPADTLNQVGQQVIGRSLNIQPTLTIRPGFEIRVLVNRDLVLEPYTESGGG